MLPCSFCEERLTDSIVRGAAASCPRNHSNCAPRPDGLRLYRGLRSIAVTFASPLLAPLGCLVLVAA